MHQANLYHTFGSGIAATIKKMYPSAYEADLSTPYGDTSKLGSYSGANINGITIINLYSQIGISAKHRTTDYASMGKGMEKVRSWLSDLDNVRLGIPHGIGCGLAGGDWDTVRVIIEKVFGDCQFDVIVCRKN